MSSYAYIAKVPMEAVFNDFAYYRDHPDNPMYSYHVIEDFWANLN